MTRRESRRASWMLSWINYARTSAGHPPRRRATTGSSTRAPAGTGSISSTKGQLPRRSFTPTATSPGHQRARRRDGCSSPPASSRTSACASTPPSRGALTAHERQGERAIRSGDMQRLRALAEDMQGRLTAIATDCQRERGRSSSWTAIRTSAGWCSSSSAERTSSSSSTTATRRSIACEGPPPRRSSPRS